MDRASRSYYNHVWIFQIHTQKFGWIRIRMDKSGEVFRTYFLLVSYADLGDNLTWQSGRVGFESIQIRRDSKYWTYRYSIRVKFGSDRIDPNFLRSSSDIPKFDPGYFSSPKFLCYNSTNLKIMIKNCYWYYWGNKKNLLL